MAFSKKWAAWLFILAASAAGGVWIAATAGEGQFGTPKGAEGTRIFKATEHPYYSGEFRLKGDRATLVGSMGDTPPWDHLDYAGKHLMPVKGTIDIAVNEVTNTGRVEAEFVERSEERRVGKECRL